jgi:tetratricopeptide (TPR) repeat protein
MEIVPGRKRRRKREGRSPSGATRDASDELVKKLPETLALNDDTLLEHTEFTSSNPAVPGSLLSHLDPSKQPALHPLDQCILLSLCLNVCKTSPAHGLTTEQMAPYVARVISHPENWSVHTMSLLLRSRLEAHRTRTVERSTLQLQALIDQMPTADSTLAERLRLLHALPLPSKWELERELALRFLSLGVVKSALEIFERLEMWEEAIKCWQETEQRDRALAVVRDLLAGRRAEAEAVLARGKASATGPRRAALDAAREAKLWCLLGELEPERAREHFEHAWAVSGETSGRAMRSLGGYFFSREEYTEAARCLRRAVAINPLFSRSWFILGCACIREQDWEGAREAFLRCVTIDDEDAESWNNLASVYLRMGYIPGGKKVSQGEVRRAAAAFVPFHFLKPFGRLRTKMTMSSSFLWRQIELPRSRSRTRCWLSALSCKDSNFIMGTGGCG